MPGPETLIKVPGFKKYNTLLLFIAKALIVFSGFLFVKFIHRNLLDSSVSSAISSYLRDFDVYSLMANTIIYPAEYILNLLGHQTILDGRIISIPGFRGVVIHGPCMGFDVFSVFIALIIAFPSKATWSRKTFFILIGLVFIHLLNILRVSALLIKNRYSWELPVDHHDLFNILIYAFVFTLFYFWIKYNSKSSVPVSEES